MHHRDAPGQAVLPACGPADGKGVFLGLALCLFSSTVLSAEKAAAPAEAARPPASLEETRIMMGKWIETQQIISKERKDWQQGKEILQGRLELVKKEVGTLEEKIKQAQARDRGVRQQAQRSARRGRAAQDCRQPVGRGGRDHGGGRAREALQAVARSDPDETAAAVQAHPRGSRQDPRLDRRAIPERSGHPQRAQQGQQRDQRQLRGTQSRRRQAPARCRLHVRRTRAGLLRQRARRGRHRPPERRRLEVGSVRRHRQGRPDCPGGARGQTHAGRGTPAARLERKP